MGRGPADTHSDHLWLQPRCCTCHGPGGGRFVVLNTTGGAWTSPDGLVWSDCNGTGPQLTQLTFQGDLFAAFGPGGGKEQPPRTLYTSKDGLQWVAGAEVPSFAIAPALVYGNGRYLAISSSDQGLVSQDGDTWQPLQLHYEFSGGHNGYAGGAYGNSRLMVLASICDPGGCYTNLLTSTNGSDWATDFWSNNPLHAITFGNGRFVGVGDRGKIVTSDGAGGLWESATTSMPVTQVAYGDGRFVAAGAWGALLVSEDGRGWTEPAPGAMRLPITSNLHLYYGGKQFVATGSQKHSGAVVYTSPDGKEWARADEAPAAPDKPSPLPSIPGKTVVSAAEDEGFLVAVTEDGEIWAKR
jgi:hypothetical protein